MLNVISGLLSGGAAPAAATSYESIATGTPSGVSSYTFSSIPSGYKHLQIRGFANGVRATYGVGDMFFRINGDTAANYSWHRLTGNGSTAAAVAGTSTTYMLMSSCIATTAASSSMFGGWVIDILDYQDTNKYKTTRLLGGTDTNGTVGGAPAMAQISSGSWRSTAAVTSLTFYSNEASSFSTGTSIALYGIKG